MTIPGISELYVLVVDDTVVYRRILQKVVDEIPNAKVVGVAANGRIALERLGQLEVDIVLLDVEMPEMNGIEALKEIRHRWPGIGVVLISGADRRSADLTMQALDLGALDFVPKADTGDAQRNHRQLVEQLEVVFRGFERRRLLSEAQARTSVKPGPEAGSAARISCGIAVGNGGESGTQSGAASGRTPARAALSALARVQPTNGFGVLLIGCSTGGPHALAAIIPLLPADLGVPVLIVQHMPPVFTASLAERLNRASALLVCEANSSQLVEANHVYVAPGGRHMAIYGELGHGECRLALSDEAPVNSCRPSVDVLFRSAVAVYGGATLSVVLTGMGEDGLDGVRALRVAGGKTLTQSEGSCVVYGMPRAVDLAGCSDESVSLENMPVQIVKWLRRGQGRR